MAMVFTINGKDESDELKRMAAFTKLDKIENTKVLDRLAELSDDPVAVSMLSSLLGYEMLKAALKKFKGK